MASSLSHAGNGIDRQTTLGASLLAFLGVGCIAGGALIAASVDVPPIATGFWRMALAGPMCLLVALRCGNGVPWRAMGPLMRGPHIWIAGVTFALTISLWYSGQRLSSIASTSALHNLAPIMIVSLAWLISGIAPRAVVIAGIASALIGATLLTFHSGGLSDRALQGDLLALASAATLAAYYSAIAKLSRGAGIWLIMAMVSIIAAPPLLLLSLAVETRVMPGTPGEWGALAALAVLGQIMGQGLLAFAARRLGALGISVAALSEPAMAALFAALLLGAPAYVAHVFGTALVLIGVWFCRSGRQPA